MSLCIFWNSVDAVCRRSCKATSVLLILSASAVVVSTIDQSQLGETALTKYGPTAPVPCHRADALRPRRPTHNIPAATEVGPLAPFLP